MRAFTPQVFSAPSLFSTGKDDNQECHSIHLNNVLEHTRVKEVSVSSLCLTRVISGVEGWELYKPVGWYMTPACQTYIPPLP